MSAEDLEKYETEMELTLYKEYRDIVSQFSYVVETERRFYLANSVDVAARNADGEIYFEVRMSDAWVWDMYRPARFVKNVRVLTFKDVNVEELDKPDLPAAGRRTVRLLTQHTDVPGPLSAGGPRLSPCGCGRPQKMTKSVGRPPLPRSWTHGSEGRAGAPRRGRGGALPGATRAGGALTELAMSRR